MAAIWDAANRKISDLRIMTSDDKVALKTMDDICALLGEWKRAAENAGILVSGRRRILSGNPARPSRPLSARSTGRSSSIGNNTADVRPPYSYSLDFHLNASQTVRDYSARVRAGPGGQDTRRAVHASTLTDTIGVLRAIQKTAQYSARDAVTVASEFGPNVPPLHLQNRDEDQEQSQNRFDFVQFEPSALSEQWEGKKDAIQVKITPRVQRPASARMANRRDTSAVDRTAYTSTSFHQRPLSARQRPLSSSSASTRTPVLEMGMFQQRLSVPTDKLYNDANVHDHHRWLQAATCAELVDVICRRPHKELAEHAPRLQDHLQIFNIFRNTFNSRDELERQHATIQNLHERCRGLELERSHLRSEAHSLREALMAVKQASHDMSEKISDLSGISKISQADRGGDALADRSATGTAELMQSATLTKSATFSRHMSAARRKKIETDAKRDEEIVNAANDEYAIIEGTRGLFQSAATDDFYQGLDGYNGMPIAVGEVDLFKMMEHEFCFSEGADEVFQTYNFGGLETTLRQEWEYAVTPDKKKRYPGQEPKKDKHGKPYPKRDDGEYRPLEFFLSQDIAKKAGLRRVEIIGLRLHTGPCYMLINGALRSGGAKNVTRKHSFTVTISMINSAIRKLVRVTPIDAACAKLYRGISQMSVPRLFFDKDEKNCRGFVEPGFSSTTTDWEVAVDYAGDIAPTILEIETGQVDSGADLKWISQFPNEKEMLISPLSNFEVVSMCREYCREDQVNGPQVNVFKCRLNLNMNSKTLESILEARKTSVIDFGRSLWNEARQIVQTPPLESGILNQNFSADYLFGDLEKMDADWFHDCHNFYKSFEVLFHNWRQIMHEAANSMKRR